MKREGRFVVGLGRSLSFAKSKGLICRRALAAELRSA
jgi:hypothetical protein